MANLLEEITGGLDLSTDSDAYKKGVKRTPLGDLLSEGLPGAVVTDTDRPENAKYGDPNSYHKVPNTAVDLRITKGVTKQSVKSFLERKGYAIKELLGPGDPGHADHVHVAADLIQGSRKQNNAARTGKPPSTRKADSMASRPRPTNNSILDAVYQEITGEASPQFAEQENRVSPVVDVSAAGADLKTRNMSAVEAADSALKIFDESAAALQSVQDQRETNLRTANEHMNQINDVVQADTTQLIKEIADPQSRIAAIDTRLEEIASMSPIKAALKSAFNPNYSVKHLEKIRYAAQVKIENAASRYQTTTALQDRLGSLISTRYENEDTFNKLVAEGAQLDSTIATSHLGMVVKGFETVVNGIQANNMVLQAQDQAEDATLNAIQPADINVALAQARQSADGIATVAGIKIPVQKLQFRADQLEQQALAIESARIANQTRNIEYEQAAEQQLISNMSHSELESAAKTGSFKGVRLDPVALNNAYTNSMQTQAMAAKGAMTEADASSFDGQLSALTGTFKGAANNLRGIGGGNNQVVVGFMNNSSARINQMAEVLKSAPPAQRTILKAEFAKELSDMRVQFDKTLDSVAVAYTRDKSGQATVKAWLTGQTQAPADSADGIIALTREGNLPPGVNAGTPAGKALLAASNAQATVLRDNPKAKGPELNRLLRQKVTAAVTKSWNDSIGNELMSNVIVSAKADGHPVGNIRAVDWRNAIAAGDSAAFRRWGASGGIGLSESQARQIFNAGPNSAAWKKFQKDTATSGKQVSYELVASELQKIQTGVMLDTLDRSPSATSTFRPSHEVANYMNSAEFQNKVGLVNQGYGQQSFGNSLASNISAGSVGKSIANQAVNFRSVADQMDIVRHEALKGKPGLGYTPANPSEEASVILHSMPALTQQEATMLERALATQGGDPTAVIMGAKFKDPHLAKIQAIAAKNWNSMRSYIAMEKGGNPLSDLALEQARDR